MEVMLVLLKTGEYLIGFVEELEYEPKCHINQPHRVTGLDKFKLDRWPDYSHDEDLLIHSESILTMCDPSTMLRLQYLEMVTPPDIKERANEPVLLQEDAESDDEDDTFYVETGIDGML
jgi:hypothetical protein